MILIIQICYTTYLELVLLALNCSLELIRFHDFHLRIWAALWETSFPTGETCLDLSLPLPQTFFKNPFFNKGLPNSQAPRIPENQLFPFL